MYICIHKQGRLFHSNVLPVMIREHFRYLWTSLNLPEYKERVNIIVVTCIYQERDNRRPTVLDNAFDIAGIDLESD